MSKTTHSVARAARRALRQDLEDRELVYSAVTKDGIHAPTTDSFVNFAAKLGIGADNQMSGSTYGFNPITRNRTLLEWMYRGSWVCGAAVDSVADDMTRAGIEIKSKVDPEAIERMEDAAIDLDLWGKLNEAIKWGRLYGGSIAVLVIDGQDPRTPLDVRTIRPGQFKGIATFDRWMLDPTLEDLVTEYNTMTGTPRYYRVQQNAPYMQGKAIHYSRVVLRSGGVKLPYQQALVENLWDLSVIERIYDRLISFDAATTGAAQLVYKCYLRTLKVKDLREIAASGQNSRAMKGLVEYVNMMAKYQGIEGVTLVDGEDEYNTETHGAFTGLDAVLMQMGQQLSGGLQIPLTRLFGQSPAGLSATGESDMRNYYDSINAQQNKCLKVGVTRIYHCLARGLGIQLPDNFRIQFKSLWQLQDGERADIAGTLVTAVTAAKDAGLISDHVALKELRQSSEITGVFTNITDADIEAADRLISPPGLEEVLGQFGAGAQGNDQPTGSPGAAAAVYPGAEGGEPVQQPAPQAGPASGPDDQGSQPRRRLQLGAEGAAPAQPVRRRLGALGAGSGHEDARGRIAARLEDVAAAFPKAQQGDPRGTGQRPNWPNL